jgi:hypothetical protein
MLKRLGPRLRFVLGMATLVALLGMTAGLWWFFPPLPRVSWQFVLPIDSVHLSGNGKVVAIISGKRELTLWDAESGSFLARQTTLHDLSLPIISTAGDVVVLQEWEGQSQGSMYLIVPYPPQLWKPASGRKSLQLPGGSPTCYSAKEGLFVLLHADPNDKLCDIQTGKARLLPDAMKDFSWAQVLNDGRILGRVIDEKGLVTAWDLTAGKNLLPLPGAERDFVFSPDGRRVAAKAGPAVKIWDVLNGSEHATISRGIERTAPSRFSPDGTRLVTFNSDSAFVVERLWNIEAKPPREEGPPQPDARHPCYHFSPDGKWIMATAYPGITYRPTSTEYKIYPVSDFSRPVLSWEEKASSLPAPQFAPDSRSVFIAELEEHSSSGFLEWLLGPRATSRVLLKALDLPSGRELAVFDRGPPVGGFGHQFAFMPDGKGLLAWQERVVEIWDIPPRRPWWIEYGLPAVFGLLLLLGVRLVWRSFRNRAEVPLVSGQQMLGVAG